MYSVYPMLLSVDYTNEPVEPSIWYKTCRTKFGENLLNLYKLLEHDDVLHYAILKQKYNLSSICRKIKEKLFTSIK